MNYLKIILILISTTFAEESSNVDRFRQEISIFEKRIVEVKAGKQNIISQLNNIDRKIMLRRNLIKELKSEISSSQKKMALISEKIVNIDKQISYLIGNLADKESDLTALKSQVGDRIVSIYKRFTSQKIAFLLGARNPNEIFQRSKYVQSVRKYDNNQIEKVLISRNAIFSDKLILDEFNLKLSRERQSHQKELRDLEKLLAENNIEKEKLDSEKSHKNVLLKKIRGDEELLSALLSDRRMALLEIEAEIKSLLLNQNWELVEYVPEISFSKLSGKLPWPVKGFKVAIPFGKILHPKYKTSTHNNGIDFNTNLGSPVYAVAQGKITRISFVRGFGNMVILSHGESCFTVYARLGNIAVTEGIIISQGTKIGEVGDTGDNEQFHFEIWVNKKNLNPLKWLKKT